MDKDSHHIEVGTPNLRKDACKLNEGPKIPLGRQVSSSSAIGGGGGQMEQIELAVLITHSSATLGDHDVLVSSLPLLFVKGATVIVSVCQIEDEFSERVRIQYSRF